MRNDQRRMPIRSWLLLVLLYLGLTTVFALSPLSGGDDWLTFSDAGHHVLLGAPVYENPPRLFYNPPWVAVLLAPLTLLPFRWGWAALSIATLMVTLIIVKRWHSGWVKPILALLSPPLFYILLHGQIDALVLAGILLPDEWWGLVALSKPQVAFGLIFGIRRERWLRALILTGLVTLASLAWFGNWPLAYARQPVPHLYAPLNVWLGLWPFQVPVGIYLTLLGVRRRDERLLVAASPFMFPYATTSSLLGPWLALSAWLRDEEAVVVWLSWWGAVAYRLWMP
jgi:hypothetical protein